MSLENRQINFADGYSEPVSFDHESETLVEEQPFKDVVINQPKEEDGPKA
ncbi:MAG: hypothetical protein UX13_C0037G0007 [Candidatus Woesebacteria bacterium GW2011_GWB1_45_5]|uniref:Uncharacterized protein n=1 Tax=Candidatus Woesebacteria bacterium GW2011_GWB1_45_5 TaxID=1618581 RepID=A0A0G1PVQ9_9BACT|nr:MAG: hypothetical protein UX13_C0037G0007 [Candidatus Woesebacteria bacterium GW2011_GWB1_45_5]